jgi:hypothetical protein
MADSKSEKQEIKIMGGKAQKNSGRGKIQKGDATLGPFIVDVKEVNKSFTLNSDVWGKICLDAAKHRKDPALMVALGETQTVRLWVIGDTMFKMLLEAYEEKYG